MHLVEDRYGTLLSLEDARDHHWRSILGRMMAGTILVAWLTASAALLTTADVTTTDKVTLLGAASGLVVLLLWVVDSVLTPKTGLAALRFDHGAGTLSWVRHTVLRRSNVLTIALPHVRHIRVSAAGIPSLSLGGLLAVAKTLKQSPITDPQAAATQEMAAAPLHLRLTIGHGAPGAISRRDVTLIVAQVVEHQEAIRLAWRIAAAAGMGYQRVSSIAGLGVEIEISQHPAPSLEPVPDRETDLQQLAGEAWKNAVAPPFDPAEFKADHRISAWKPGQRVVFERALSKLRWLAAPVAALVLAGPALLVYAGITGRHIAWAGFSILTLLWLVVGGIGCAVVFIPARRRVIVDWSDSSLQIERRRQRHIHPFSRIACLETRGEVHRDSGGDSSGVSFSYRCVLLLVPRSASGESDKRIELMRTGLSSRPDDPWRQMSPLMDALAAAMDVPARATGYGTKR